MRTLLLTWLWTRLGVECLFPELPRRQCHSQEVEVIVVFPLYFFLPPHSHSVAYIGFETKPQCDYWVPDAETARSSNY